MAEFGLKGKMTDKDFMIHIQNNVPDEYDVYQDGLENCLTSSGSDVFALEVISEKLNNKYLKIKERKKRKN